MRKNKILFFSITILSLAFLYFSKSPAELPEEKVTEIKTTTAIPQEQITTKEKEVEEVEKVEKHVQKEIPVESIKKDTPASKSADVSENKETTCSLSVKCDSVFKNIENLKSNKLECIPQNGVFVSDESVCFYEGETVFNVLSRELKRNKIHFEFSKTPAYNSVYIEGIGNLYEFDCGELSGWIYKVNGKTPGVGCSQYKVKSGDVIEFIYSCGN